jgi:hypothetical protein
MLASKCYLFGTKKSEIRISAGNLRFYAISSNFSALSGFFFQQTKTGKQLMRRRISS